jgi:hypothetical protein
MSAPKAMTPLRRGPIPGMTRPSAPEVTAPPDDGRETETALPNNGHEAEHAAPVIAETTLRPSTRAAVNEPGPALERGSARGRSGDYSATRLVNFRLPVDLHDRYRRLVQEVEREHPRLRRPSLTEVIVALLEEGPDDVDGLAAVIRRKRASEYDEEQSR